VIVLHSKKTKLMEA